METRYADALREVIDPEFGLNVLDLGLIYGVAEAPEHLTVTMTLTSRFCPMAQVITAGVELALAAASEKPVTVEMVWDPAWSPERITPEGLAQLQA